MIDADIEYTLHCYDHCPFGNRVAYLMDYFSIKYKKVVYGYGSGAVPAECDGEGYDGDLNPRKLTGKKILPVLEGPGVPCAPGAVGMPESLEICSFLIGRHHLVVPCATGRSDVKALSDYLLNKKVMNPLTLSRLIKMPVADWADERDVSYHLWKHKKNGDLMEYEAAEDAAAIDAVNAKLAELPNMMHGDKSLNKWGFGMDDILLLPWLRRLTCIKGVEFPNEVNQYMSTVGSQLEDYSKHAV
jgi:glutaredoxin 2